MIIGTFKNLDDKIGQRISQGSISDYEYRKHSQPFLIIRKATKEEWIEQIGYINEAERLAIDKANFYEISID